MVHLPFLSSIIEDAIGLPGKNKFQALHMHKILNFNMTGSALRSSSLSCCDIAVGLIKDALPIINACRNQNQPDSFGEIFQTGVWFLGLHTGNRLQTVTDH